jgi:DNA polymerase III subunit delta'
MSFAQFSGSKQAAGLLQRSLERGRLSHAYLFSGNDMGELELISKTLAKTLNCANPVIAEGAVFKSDCCGQCQSCRKIGEGSHPDVQWLRPESKSRIIKIDQIRDLLQTIHLKASEAEWKVAIVVAAERLTVQAANAFLKTLEEPPPNCAILLLSLEPDRLLETILSRCLRLNFGGGSGPRLEEASLEWLRSFSEMAAEVKDGLLGRYRLLGTLLAKLGQIKEEVERVLTRNSPAERYADAEADLREKWESELAAAVEAEYRRCRGELLLGLQWWLRDVWLHQTSAGSQLPSFPAFEREVGMVAKRISMQDALENVETLERTQFLLRESNVQEALALEVGLLKLKL